MSEEGGSKGKPLDQWTKAEFEESNFNSKALHALFNAVSIGQMKNIANCETTKDAWDILQVKSEGTYMVKKTRLRRLIADYENHFLCMMMSLSLIFMVNCVISRMNALLWVRSIMMLNLSRKICVLYL